MRKFLLLTAIATLLGCVTHPDDAVRIPMALTTASGPGASVGEIVIKQATNGVDLQLRLRGLPPGLHGFHLHTIPSCEPTIGSNNATIPGGSAGGHFDPDATGHHMGPTGQGHLGDLPAIFVGANGEAEQTLHAPRFHSASELRGHAFIIHAGGDNYSDVPAPFGGGGARIACGIIQ